MSARTHTHKKKKSSLRCAFLILGNHKEVYSFLKKKKKNFPANQTTIFAIPGFEPLVLLPFFLCVSVCVFLLVRVCSTSRVNEIPKVELGKVAGRALHGKRKRRGGREERNKRGRFTDSG